MVEQDRPSRRDPHGECKCLVWLLQELADFPGAVESLVASPPRTIGKLCPNCGITSLIYRTNLVRQLSPIGSNPSGAFWIILADRGWNDRCRKDFSTPSLNLSVSSLRLSHHHHRCHIRRGCLVGPFPTYLSSEAHLTFVSRTVSFKKLHEPIKSAGRGDLPYAATSLGRQSCDHGFNSPDTLD
jgi:hypothetical protein